MVADMRRGFRTATPFLIVKDCAGAVQFYKMAFGAMELMRMTDHGGRVRHADIMIGTSPVMIDEHANVSALGPDELPPVSIYLYVDNVDALLDQAVAAGAKVLNPVTDQSYGDRECGVIDPFGVVWWIATRKGITPGQM